MTTTPPRSTGTAVAAPAPPHTPEFVQISPKKTPAQDAVAKELDVFRQTLAANRRNIAPAIFDFFIHWHNVVADEFNAEPDLVKSPYKVVVQHMRQAVEDTLSPIVPLYVVFLNINRLKATTQLNRNQKFDRLLGTFKLLLPGADPEIDLLDSMKHLTIGMAQRLEYVEDGAAPAM